MINQYKQARDYLDSFLNYERFSRFPYRRSFKLERMRSLLKHLKISCRDLRAIHIAGTKGKGSTAYLLAYLLAGSGFKVGLFTSPHLLDLRERIQIIHRFRTDRSRSGKIKSKPGSSLISKNELVNIIGEFRKNLKSLNSSKETNRVTFFELLTAVAFKYFLQKKVDFVVLESGLGGRLDSTNVVTPLVGVITHIGYDHTDKLGCRLSDIAKEKAGIIKRGVPLVCSAQRPSCLKVIKNKCKSANARLFISRRDFQTLNLRFKQNYTLFDFRFGKLILKNLKIYLKGEHQVENASLALAALDLLRGKGALDKKADYRDGLKLPGLPGRFEVVSNSPLTVVDIAHNPSSFSALGESLKRYFPRKKIIFIFACSQDKAAGNMLRKIAYSQLILTRFNNPRAKDPLELKNTVRSGSVCLAGDIAEALGIAKRRYRDNCVIVVSGSLFLASEAKKYLRGR